MEGLVPLEMKIQTTYICRYHRPI